MREYSQGAWRMRGIGIGQTITALVPPVVASLVIKSTSACTPPPTAAQALAAWLLLNGVKSEQTQFKQLCVQNLDHLYRRRAFNSLLGTVIEDATRREHVSNRRLSVRPRTVTCSTRAAVHVPTACRSAPTRCATPCRSRCPRPSSRRSCSPTLCSAAVSSASERGNPRTRGDGDGVVCACCVAGSRRCCTRRTAES